MKFIKEYTLKHNYTNHWSTYQGKSLCVPKNASTLNPWFHHFYELGSTANASEKPNIEVPGELDIWEQTNGWQNFSVMNTFAHV